MRLVVRGATGSGARSDAGASVKRATIALPQHAALLCVCAVLLRLLVGLWPYSGVRGVRAAALRGWVAPLSNARLCRLVTEAGGGAPKKPARAHKSGPRLPVALPADPLP